MDTDQRKLVNKLRREADKLKQNGHDRAEIKLRRKIWLITQTKSGVELIKQERTRQIEKEKWSPDHDDEHCTGSLALAAATYAIPDHIRKFKIWNETLQEKLWPWSPGWFKSNKEDRIRDLVKAGALCAAEIDRLQRQSTDEKR